jgi:DNA-binding MarR family transcriptional regulator
VDLHEVRPAETDAADSSAPDAEPSIEQVSDSIWRLTEEVIELLRVQASSQVRKQQRPDVLWIDDVTRAQANTVIAVRQLTAACPEGVTLRKLAETIGVTPAAASVMVDLLVKKKMLKRTRSKNDRRSVLIRLNPETTALFEITEQSLRQSVMHLAESLGEDALRDCYRTLGLASGILRQMTGTSALTVSGLADLQSEDDGEPPPETDADATQPGQAAKSVS